MAKHRSQHPRNYCDCSSFNLVHCQILTQLEGLHQQTHFRNGSASTRPSRIRRLSLRSHIRALGHTLQTEHQHVPNEESESSTNITVGFGHDLQCCSYEHLPGLFEYPILPSQPGVLDAHSGTAQLCNIEDNHPFTCCTDISACLCWRGYRFLL
jgi:hypothetical protein